MDIGKNKKLDKSITLLSRIYNFNTIGRQTSDQYYFNLDSSETVNLALPFALLLARTFLPFLVAILDLNPCLLTLFLLDG